MAYPDLDDVRAEGVSEALYPDARVEDRLALAIAYVEKRTGMCFEAREDLTLAIDGNDHDILPLPMPLLAADAIAIGNGDAVVELTADQIEALIIYSRTPPGPDDRLNPRVVWPGHRWPEGHQNVAITGTWGFVEADDSTPLAIRDVLIRLVVWDLESLGDPVALIERSEYAYATTRSVHNRSVSLASLAVSGGKTGVPAIDGVLAAYRRPWRGYNVRQRARA